MSNHSNRSRAKSPASNPKKEDIKAARESAGLTQSEFGELIYCSLRTVQQWESGDRRMHPAFWELINIKLGVVVQI